MDGGSQEDEDRFIARLKNRSQVAAAVADSHVLRDRIEAAQSPVAWIVEWGAIDLAPEDPARITCLSAHASEEDAVSFADTCEFSHKVFAVYTRRETPNV